MNSFALRCATFTALTFGITAITPASCAVVNSTIDPRDRAHRATTTRLSRIPLRPTERDRLAILFKFNPNGLGIDTAAPISGAAMDRGQNGFIIMVPATVTFLWDIPEEVPVGDSEHSGDELILALDAFTPPISRVYDHYMPVAIGSSERRRHQSYATLFCADTHTIAFAVILDQALVSHPILQEGPYSLPAPIPEPAGTLLVGLGFLSLFHRIRYRY